MMQLSCKKRLRHLCYWVFPLLLLVGNSVRASEATAGILFSVKPLALLYIELTALPVEPEQILIASGKNLHDYHLSLADIKLLKSAEQVFWMGVENEALLIDLANKSEAKKSAKWQAVARSEHEWLSLEGQLALIARFSLVLQGVHPELKLQIISNEQKLVDSLRQQFAGWGAESKELSRRSVLMAHSAFELFLSDLSLPAPEFYSTGHSHGKAAQGGRHGLHVQQQIMAGEILCAIEEPDASFHQLKKKFPQLRLVMLEPMADSQVLKQGEWLRYWQHNWQMLSQCVGVN